MRGLRDMAMETSLFKELASSGHEQKATKAKNVHEVMSAVLCTR